MYTRTHKVNNSWWEIGYIRFRFGESFFADLRSCGHVEIATVIEGDREDGPPMLLCYTHHLMRTIAAVIIRRLSRSDRRLTTFMKVFRSTFRSM